MLPGPAPANPAGHALRVSLRKLPKPAEPAPGRILDEGASEAARADLRTWPGYEPSPLFSLSDLADRLGVEAVWCKDESDRFGIGAFKALGGALATRHVLADEIERRTGNRPTPDELRRGHPEAAGITTTTASAGNHGRSVAWGSQLFGCRCVVVLPGDASPVRAEAIASHGATVERYPGGYDDAVAYAARKAEEEGWIVVSDTAYAGYEETPRRIMQGYTLLAAELLEDLRAEGKPPLTHLFIQAGVGGLAAGVCGHLALTLGDAAPRFIAVEPWRADCFGRSLRAGDTRTATGPFDTRMGGLAAGVASTLAWTLLSEILDGAVAIPEAAWREAAAALAAGELGARIDAGPSGASGVGALLALTRLHDVARLLGIEAGSRIGVLVTEKRFEDS